MHSSDGINEELDKIIAALGGEEGLRLIASEAVQQCCDDVLEECIRTALRLQFNWPTERGSQATAARHLDVHEGTLSRFKNGEREVFLSMPRRRLDDILWRLDIEPENARPDRERVMLSVMRRTLAKVNEVREKLGDKAPPDNLCDETLTIVAQLAPHINPEVLKSPVSRPHLEQSLRQINAVLIDGAPDYLRSGRKFGNPLALLRAVVDWLDISELLPYQFALLIILPRIIESWEVAMHSTQWLGAEEEAKRQSREYAETMHHRVSVVVTRVASARRGISQAGEGDHRVKRLREELAENLREQVETWQRVCAVRSAPAAGGPMGEQSK